MRLREAQEKRQARSGKRRGGLKDLAGQIRSLAEKTFEGGRAVRDRCHEPPREVIGRIAEKYDLQIVYAFGSRAKEALAAVEGRIDRLPEGLSDLDVGIKGRRPLTVEEKVEIGILLEDLFGVTRVDVVVLSEAPVFLAVDIVSGEVLFAQDSTYEAEYQLFVLRRAAELMPYEKAKREMILGY